MKSKFFQQMSHRVWCVLLVVITDKDQTQDVGMFSPHTMDKAKLIC